MASRAELFANWWEYHRLANGSRDERKALEGGEPAKAVEAFERVADLVSTGDADVVTLLEELNDAAPEDEGATVGSGPLEDLIHEHGDRLVDELAERARHSPLFAQALAATWLDADRLQPTTVDRLSLWVRTSR
jgi:hypothetical protein